MAEAAITDNITMRLWLETIESVLGSNGLNSVLNYAHLSKYIDNFPPDDDNLEISLRDLRDFYIALLELFGQKGAKGLQLRVGREFIRIGLQKRPAIANTLKFSTKFLPRTFQIRLALSKMSDEYERRQPSPCGSSRITVQENENYFLFIDNYNFESDGITSDTPVCYSWVGRLQYLIEWITGHHHEVKEIQCRAMGDSADIFRISKKRSDLNL